MDDCIDTSNEAKIFRTLVWNSGYWQIPFDELDRDKTAFVSHQGLFRFTSITFGHKLPRQISARNRYRTQLYWMEICNRLFGRDHCIIENNWRPHGSIESRSYAVERRRSYAEATKMLLLKNSCRTFRSRSEPRLSTSRFENMELPKIHASPRVSAR